MDKLGKQLTLFSFGIIGEQGGFLLGSGGQGGHPEAVATLPSVPLFTPVSIGAGIRHPSSETLFCGQFTLQWLHRENAAFSLTPRAWSSGSPGWLLPNAGLSPGPCHATALLASRSSEPVILFTSKWGQAGHGARTREVFKACTRNWSHRFCLFLLVSKESPDLSNCKASWEM
jgi:hypothetical protein